MGTWGPGNFENDSALDMLNYWVRCLINRAREIINDPDLILSYECGDRELIPIIDVICTLTDVYGNLIDDETAIEMIGWKEKYINSFSAEKKNPATSDEFIADRKLVISSTFDRLFDLYGIY